MVDPSTPVTATTVMMKCGTATVPVNSLTCEIIPEAPLSVPAVGAKVTVDGILRFDLNHNWQEIHPVLKIE